MKYTLHIAFSKSVGDILLRICEYVNKFGNSSAKCIHPLLFDYVGDNIEVKRPEKNCPLGDYALFALEMKLGIPLRWMVHNSSEVLKTGQSIEDYFEKEFTAHIIEENNVDAEMHLVFYIPLYELGMSEKVRKIITNLPHGHKFIVNVVGITYDMASACNLLENDIRRDARTSVMTKNMEDLTSMTDVRTNSGKTLLKHIFIFQNYNINGWSLNFNRKRFIDVCANLSVALAEHYDVLCHYSWLERPVYAINVRSQVIDIFMAVNHIFRDLFKWKGQENIIDKNAVDKEKVKEAYKKILQSEVELIEKFKNNCTTGLDIQSKYDESFLDVVRDDLKKVVSDNIQLFNLNVSEQQYLYSLFSGIDNRTNFESEDFDEAIWQLEEMMLQELEGSETLQDTYRRLKRCSKELSETKNAIKEQESIIEDLKNKIDVNYPSNGEITEEGIRIGNEVFKPNNHQETPLDETYQCPNNQDLPSSVDLRKEFPGIKNQGPQGACSAFSLVSVIEYFIHKILRDSVDLSEAFVYYNARKLSGDTEIDEGATFTEIIQSIRDNGVCLEELCPYNPKVYNEEPSEEAYGEADSRKITEAKNVRLEVDDIKSALAQGYPVVISARAFRSYVTNANGVLSMPSSKELDDDKAHNHAMVICGYIDKEGFFIVRNSWGTNFGDNGYCYLPYEYVRTPNVLNGAYVVTGININGFKAGDLPTIDSLLHGKDYNAQYAIYSNMLHEANRNLSQTKIHLDKLHKEYLNLYNQIADYSSVELSMKELKSKTEEQRKELEDKLRRLIEESEKEKNAKKGLWTKLFRTGDNHSGLLKKRQELEEQIKKLDHVDDNEKRHFRVRLAILNGLRSINQEFISESVRMTNLSNFYTNEFARIDHQNELEENEYSYLTKILPIDSIISKLKLSAIGSLFTSFGSTLSRINNGEIGLYETLGDIQAQILNTLSQEVDVRISDYLDKEIFTPFYRQINHTSVMAQIRGTVPSGYGDETKYFFCNTAELPKQVSREVEDVTMLNIKDNLRMCFIHMEKYNMEDFVIFDCPKRVDNHHIPFDENGKISDEQDLRNVGSVKSLTGKITIAISFLTDTGVFWTETERDEVLKKTALAEHWLRKESQKWGSSVSFDHIVIGNNVKTSNLPHNPDLPSKQSDFLDFSIDKNKWSTYLSFIEDIKKNQSSDGVLVMSVLKGVGRAWSWPATSNSGRDRNAPESIVIFESGVYSDGTPYKLHASTIAHEILHVCGAWDLYNSGSQTKEHADKAKELFPDSIMLNSKENIDDNVIDELTAWLVGIGPKKDWFIWFEPETNREPPLNLGW